MKNRIIGIILLVGALVMALVLNLPTTRGKDVSFRSTYGNDEVVLKGTYWNVEDSEYAVLICPGYSCDRQKWRPFADLFVGNGFSTLAFDYSGQGASSGVIGFDNAKTDNIPKEIDDAIEQLHTLSGIDYDHIILVGHSMGGRSILRLLYDYNDENAVTSVNKKHINHVILMSAEVNYNFNAQASLFAGTSDAEEEPWKSFDSKHIQGTDLYLYGSTADDIVMDEDVLALAKRLGMTNIPDSGKVEAVEVLGNGSKVTLGVTGGVLHSYIMYSDVFAEYVNNALESITGQSVAYNSKKMNLVYGMWFAGLLGLYFLLKGLNGKKNNDEVELTLVDEKKFLGHKVLMWLPGTVVAFVICCLCILAPFGSPVMNIPYMNFIAGYGIVMAFSYRKGKFKGTAGKLEKLNFKIEWDWKCFGVTAGICGIVLVILRATMYRLIPVNYRLLWLVICTVLMTIGYYVSGCENDMLHKEGISGKTRLIYNLIQYIPLFLLVGFYLVLKSYSGMIGQMQNMVLMYIFCIPMGDYVRKCSKNRLLGAVVSAFLFQTLMITSAALISMF